MDVPGVKINTQKIRSYIRNLPNPIQPASTIGAKS